MGLFGSPKAADSPPAIGALNVQQSSYGTPITLVYGTNRVTGNLLYYTDFSSQEISASGGGKGGGGGGGKGGGSGEYNYFATFQIGLCEGPISSIGTCWVSKAIMDTATLGGVVGLGTLDQAPWGYLTTNHPEAAIGYNLLSTLSLASYALGTSPETPQFSFEIFGLLVIGSGNNNAYCDQVFSDFLNRCAFPSEYIGDLTDFANYCKAMGFFISPIIDQQQQATEWFNEFTATLNCDFINSAGVITVKPYADSIVTGNGVTYTPNLTPIYDLDDDDFIVDGDDDPITITIPEMADAYNQQPIEYCNAANQYNIETYTAEDAAHIDQYGIRTAPTLQAHHITDPVMAQTMAYLNLWRQIYVQHGPGFSFKLPWNYIILDPMDLITITDTTLGLTRKLVRINKIEEDEDGLLTFTCEDMPGAIAAPALYASQNVTRHTPNYNQDPGPVNTPIIFESPLALVQSSDVEIDLAVSGANPLWGGCDVYVSNDGETYQYLQKVQGGARTGLLTADLPNFSSVATTNNIDTTSTLAIDMTQSEGALNNSATNMDAINFNTLCYVDGELISYGQDVLTAEYKYNLTYLNRGCYGSPISDHPIGRQFARVDQAIIRYPVDQSRVGQTIYFKFVSFNIWGGSPQQIADVMAYNYKILGTALLTPLANPSSLTVSYVDNVARLNWTGITDIRYPILYEIRKGATLSSAQIIGNTTATNYLVQGTDTYWVTALFLTPFGVAVYSASPPSIAVTTPSIQQNLIQFWEESPSWTGTVGGGAVVSGSVIELQNQNLLPETNILTISNVLNITPVSASGSYTAPTGHIITTNSISNAKVIINWTIEAVSNTSDVTTISDIVTTPDITGIVSSPLVTATPQIQVSQDKGVTFSAWQNWVPGVYPGNAWNYQILLSCMDPTVTAILSQFSIEVDVPDRTETGTLLTSTGGSTVSYADQFNAIPLPQIVIKNEVSGDWVSLTSESESGFTVQIFNSSGTAVARNINWSVTDY